MVEEMLFHGGTRVLVWRLDEEAPQLLALCREAGVSCEDLMDMPVKRQREKAVERLLLCLAAGHPATLSHDEQGAPMVEGEQMNISITHTQRLVALAVDRRQVIGLDAESEDRQQVLRVRDKYLNDHEKQFINPDDLVAHIVAWTAKEAIIKAERNSALDWTHAICLEPFSAADPLTDEFIFTARCGDRRYRLATRCIEGHYLTLAVGCPG